ncbi:MAG: plasmid recombination protein [Pseudomonadota bacterium]
MASASPEYFRPGDPSAVGTWDEDRLERWIDATMDHIEVQFGDDLVFAELHLDEDTPHIHFVVAPTYQKTARKPGRQKRNETIEEFEARKRAVAARPTVRTVGRASHSELSMPGSFQRLREHMALAVNQLGIEYGEDRSPAAPKGQSTRQWVNEMAVQLSQQAAEQKRRDRDLDGREGAISRREEEAYEAGRARAIFDANEALAIAETIVKGEVSGRDLPRRVQEVREAINKIKETRERDQHMRRYGQNATSNWSLGESKYLQRAGENWGDALARVREAHERGMEKIRSVPRIRGLLERARHLLAAINDYWKAVGGEVLRLFRFTPPLDDNEVYGILDRLIPDPLDERGALYELSREAEQERHKLLLVQSLLPSRDA